MLVEHLNVYWDQTCKGQYCYVCMVHIWYMWEICVNSWTHTHKWHFCELDIKEWLPKMELWNYCNVNYSKMIDTIWGVILSKFEVDSMSQINLSIFNQISKFCSRLWQYNVSWKTYLEVACFSSTSA